jgi:hypothetical protein
MNLVRVRCHSTYMTEFTLSNFTNGSKLTTGHNRHVFSSIHTVVFARKTLINISYKFTKGHNSPEKWVLQ